MSVALSTGCRGATQDGATADIVAQVPFEAGESLTYALYSGAGELAGYGVLSVEAGDGVLLLRQQYRATGDATIVEYSTVTVEAATLRPLAMERVVSPAGGEGATAEAQDAGEYAADGASVVIQRTRDGERKTRTLKLPPGAFDNESSLWLWRSLNLHEGYEARYASVNVVEREQDMVGLAVAAREEITTPAGDFGVWRLQVRSGRAVAVAWVEVAPPHRIVQWDNGSTLFRLEAVEQAVEQAAGPDGAAGVPGTGEGAE